MGKHAEWRKLAKKLRRKRIRTMIAVARDQQLLLEQEKRERSPTYRAWLEEQSILEEFNAAEEKRLAMERQKMWEAEEDAALLRWREQQSRLAQAKAEKFKREVMLKEDWEREQRKIEEAEEARKKSEDEKKRKQAELLAQINAFIEGGGELPGELNVSSQTQPGHPDCPFFSKTGACRFRDGCSRNHCRPGISRTLLIPNFYDHFGLQTLHHDEYDTDLGLEYEDSETYQHFKEFYKDVLPEFEQCGRITQFKVCNNEEPHLRGNVYVEFESRRHALKAYRTFQGRFYAGRRLNVEFTDIPSWPNAICGLFHRKKCPKGKTCNFLHVFRNPNNAFRIPGSSSRRQFSRSRSRSPPRRRSRSREWNWSDGSDSEDDRRKRSRSHSRNRELAKYFDYESGDERGKSPSRTKDRPRNRDTSRDRRKVRRKDKKRDEKYRRSKSKSPHREKKHNKDERFYDSDKKSRKDKQDDTRNDKETNGREKDHSSKSSKKVREDDAKKSNKDKYDREYSKKRQKKERSEEVEKRDTKSKKRVSEQSSVMDYNGKEDCVDKRSGTKRIANSSL